VLSVSINDGGHTLPGMVRSGVVKAPDDESYRPQ